ncbi:hypothetical protein BD779DRAFT_1479592 [Infundibulicybe gibba]|nr:hypothetical protein BD779DRAFT_1479592 [Infundibulicybe gibba]
MSGHRRGRAIGRCSEGDIERAFVGAALQLGRVRFVVRSLGDVFLGWFGFDSSITRAGLVLLAMSSSSDEDAPPAPVNPIAALELVFATSVPMEHVRGTFWIRLGRGGRKRCWASQLQRLAGRAAAGRRVFLRFRSCARRSAMRAGCFKFGGTGPYFRVPARRPTSMSTFLPGGQVACLRLGRLVSVARRAADKGKGRAVSSASAVRAVLRRRLERKRRSLGENRLRRSVRPRAQSPGRPFASLVVPYVIAAGRRGPCEWQPENAGCKLCKGLRQACKFDRVNVRKREERRLQILARGGDPETELPANFGRDSDGAMWRLKWTLMRTLAWIWTMPKRRPLVLVIALVRGLLRLPATKMMAARMLRTMRQECGGQEGEEGKDRKGKGKARALASRRGRTPPPSADVERMFLDDLDSAVALSRASTLAARMLPPALVRVPRRAGGWSFLRSPIPIAGSVPVMGMVVLRGRGFAVPERYRRDILATVSGISLASTFVSTCTSGGNQRRYDALLREREEFGIDGDLSAGVYIL